MLELLQPILLSAWLSGQALDVHSTYHALNSNPHAVEGNPIYFGKPKLIIPIKGAVNGGMLVVWKKTKSKKARVVTALIFAGTGYAAAISNYKVSGQGKVR